MAADPVKPVPPPAIADMHLSELQLAARAEGAKPQGDS